MSPLNKFNVLAHVEIRNQVLAICATPIPATRPYEARDRNGKVVYPGYLRTNENRAVFVGDGGRAVAEFELPGWVLVNSSGTLPPASGEADEPAGVPASHPVIVRQMLTPFAPLQPLSQEEAEALMKEEESFFEQPEFVEAANRVLARGGEVKTFMAIYRLEGARKAVTQ